MGRKVVRVVVTKKDIHLGVKHNSIRCPIARALRRLGKQDIYVEGSWDWFKGMIDSAPERVCEFICKFDKGKKVSPISFNLYEN